MGTFLSIVSTTALFGVTLIFVKVTSRLAYPLVSNLLFTAAAAVIQVIFLVLARKLAWITGSGFAFSLLGGVFLGLYTVGLFFTLSQTRMTQAVGIIYVGAIVIASVYGYLALNEQASWVNIIGLVMACSGLLLLSWS